MDLTHCLVSFGIFLSATKASRIFFVPPAAILSMSLFAFGSIHRIKTWMGEENFGTFPAIMAHWHRISSFFLRLAPRYRWWFAAAIRSFSEHKRPVIVKLAVISSAIVSCETIS